MPLFDAAVRLEDRRALLQGLPLAVPMRRVELVDDERPWERARREGWEGVIAKRRGSPYEHRRSKHWLKMKGEVSQELVVGGFTDPQGARVGLGALLVSYYETGEFVFAGKIGTGFDTYGAGDPAPPARAAGDDGTLPPPGSTRRDSGKRLEELTRPSWIKTTGSKGFHIVVPLDGTTPMGAVARFANAVGTVFVSRAADRLTQEFSKADRSGRI